MLTIICGEDPISSRDYYFNLKKDYMLKNFEVSNIPAPEVPEILKGLSEAPTLFSQNRVFFTEGLNKKLSKRSDLVFYKSVEQITDLKNITVIDWEQHTPARDLKISKDVTIKEFKAHESIFKLLDACYPGNLKNFIMALHGLPPKTDEVFIFIMLARHLRNLLSLKYSDTVSGMQTWQLSKLKSQGKLWATDKLLAFYDGLHRIDLSIKTGKNPFTVKKSLDILATYFL